MFAAGGLPFSVDVVSADAFVPILRDAVATALTRRTCVHLGIPVDVQAAECPVPPKPFCAADARARITFPTVVESVLDEVVHELKDASQGRSRTIIVVGHRCVNSGEAILRLAERIHAPIFTRLDAKGCCNESHPLVWGVIGVHGKPGLEASAAMVQTAELVLSFGVHDLTLLLCNRAGLQIRPMIQFEEDAVCVLANVRFNAHCTVIGDVTTAVDAILGKLGPELSTAMEGLSLGMSSFTENWSNALANSGMDITQPTTSDILGTVDNSPSARGPPANKDLDALELWKSLHSGSWRKLQCQKSFMRL